MERIFEIVCPNTYCCLRGVWKNHIVGWRILRWPRGSWQSSFREAENNGRLMVSTFSYSKSEAANNGFIYESPLKATGQTLQMTGIDLQPSYYLVVVVPTGNSLLYATREEATGICLVNNGQWFSKVMPGEPRSQS